MILVGIPPITEMFIVFSIISILITVVLNIFSILLFEYGKTSFRWCDNTVTFFVILTATLIICAYLSLIYD